MVPQPQKYAAEPSIDFQIALNVVSVPDQLFCVAVARVTRAANEWGCSSYVRAATSGASSNGVISHGDGMEVSIHRSQWHPGAMAGSSNVSGSFQALTITWKA